MEDDQGDRLWPAPPDQPRFAYQTSLRSLADMLEVTEEAKLRHLLTRTRPPDSPVLEKPSMLAARNGRVFVADSVRRCIVVFDAPRRRVFLFGLRAPGTLAKPTAIALDRGGLAYVADATLRRIFVYDTLGLHQQSIGGPAQLERPTGVAVSPDGSRIYVVDRSDNDSVRHRVLIYGRDGKLLQEIGQRGNGEGEFNVPVQATVTPDSNLHVLDAGNFRVQTFDPEGRFLRSFGRVGAGLGQFARPRALASDDEGRLYVTDGPRALASDDEGRLYVTDGAFGNVQIFAAQGQLLLAVGRAGRRDRPGRYGVISGVAVDDTGRIYIVDQLFAKVEVIRRLSEQEGGELAARAAKKS